MSARTLLHAQHIHACMLPPEGYAACSPSFAEALLDVFETFSNEIVLKFVPAIVYSDYDDKPFLETAIYTDGFLVTNNIRDFPSAGYTLFGQRSSWL